MKMVGIEKDREKAPLMKALHELGIDHGVMMVVVTISMTPGNDIASLLIDHKDDTTVEEVIQKFTGAGVFLIKAAAAAEEYAHEQTQVDASKEDVCER